LSEKIGVIIGRFQVPKLHAGHLWLLDYVKRRHDKRLILLGTPPTLGTRNNPLDYKTREAMMLPHGVVRRLSDMESDCNWSAQVDAILDNVFPWKDAVIYGSRDSFIPRYSGRHMTELVPPYQCESGTLLRAEVAAKPMESNDFRAGVIYSCLNQFPRVFMTVDIAITSEDKVILGRKAGSSLWRFPGGFVDPSDSSLKAAAGREISEECPAIEFGGYESLNYVSSRRVEDWRYRGQEKIITALFHGGFVFGQMVAGDDLEEIRWFSIQEADSSIWPAHRVLLDDLKSYLKKSKEAA
jgi:bifunctional NMN adenylyltransferase/nudix hydrolase